MILQDIGNLIRKQRNDLGLTQGQLGELAALSRATIVDLEAGKVTDLGVAKLEKLLAVLEWSLVATIQPATRKKSDDPIALAARSASTSYRKILTREMLEEALASGVIPTGYTAHLAALINEVPAPLLARTVKAVAKNRHTAPRLIWQNLSRWSRELQTTRAF